MTISLDDLIDELQIHAPVGVEVPRDPNDNEVARSTIDRWAADAAQAINERRGKTTTKETTITLQDDTVDYDLPSDCRDVQFIDRRHSTVTGQDQVLGIPGQRYGFGLGPLGYLPTGQELSPSVDAINRMRLANVEREDDFEIFGGQIRFLFPIEAGEEIKVRYTAIDRSYGSVGDDRFTMILDYLMIQNLDWYIAKHGATISQDGDSFGPDTMPALYRRKRELEDRWLSSLNSIGPEAN